LSSRSKTLKSPRGSSNVKNSLYRRHSTRKTRLEKDFQSKKTMEAFKLDKIEESMEER
jgi:hypothetical protein